MKRLVVVFLTAVMIPAFALGTRLEKIAHWKHAQTYWGPISGSFLDSAGDLILTFRKSGPVAVSQDKTAAIAPFGQSPDEATQVFTACEYRGDLALFEDVNKIKIFRRTGKTYHGEKTIWLKRDPFLFLLKTALFVNGRFFLAGVKMLNNPVSAEKVTSPICIPLRKIHQRREGASFSSAASNSIDSTRSSGFLSPLGIMSSISNKTNRRFSSSPRKPSMWKKRLS